jgi:hypothetical protein
VGTDWPGWHVAVHETAKGLVPPRNSIAMGRASEGVRRAGFERLLQHPAGPSEHSVRSRLTGVTLPTWRVSQRRRSGLPSAGHADRRRLQRPPGRPRTERCFF